VQLLSLIADHDEGRSIESLLLPFHRWDSTAGLIRAVTSDNLFCIGLRWTRHAGNALNASFDEGIAAGG
jgi:hypothetical protein